MIKPNIPQIFRHIVRGALVHMIRQEEELPFDLAATRAIKYPQFDTAGTQLLEDVEKKIKIH